MIHERALTDFNIKKEKLNKLKSEMQQLRDTMSALTSLGVVTDDAYQALTEAYINAKNHPYRKNFKIKLK